MLDILHERQFAEALDDSVVVHGHDGVVLADLRRHLADALDQVEAAARPVAGQVLRAAIDRAVRLDQAGTTDADEGRDAQAFLGGVPDLLAQHLAEPLHRLLTARLLVGMAPELGFPNPGLAEIGGLVLAQFDDARADVGATDVDCDQAVIGFEDPFRREMGAADQPGLVRVMAHRHQLDRIAFGLQDDAGPRDRELADPALPEAAADDDALDRAPGLLPQEASDDEGERLGEALDSREHQRRLACLTLGEQLVELRFARRLAGLRQRVLAVFGQMAAQFGEMVHEGAAARLVAEEAVGIADFEIVAGDDDRGQLLRSMRPVRIRPARCRHGHRIPHLENTGERTSDAPRRFLRRAAACPVCAAGGAIQPAGD